ncbi:MAG: heme-copper oxidase subunit III, partial [Chloroflexi bacterium]|nr:heme-copper oxidase subunit III [Chloroflexota bacterium]
IMFFTALIGAYIGFRAAGEFTLPEIPTIIPAIGTFILIMSSLTAVLALDSLQRDREVPFILALLGIVVLGIVFLGIQGFEWTELFEKGITPTSDLFGTAFFVLTGFHGLHVAIGLIVLVFVMLRAFLGEFSRERFAGVETFGLYWHFVDIVWIVLFTVIYLIG